MKNATRRDFVRTAGVFSLAGLLQAGDAAGQADGILVANPELVLGEDEGEVYLIGPRRGRVVIKVDRHTKGIASMSLLTEDIEAEDRIPVHKHLNEDELIFIQRGAGILTFGDEEKAVGPGSIAFVPRGVWHGLRNEGEETIRMVFGYSPAGFEDYFRAIGVKPGEASRSLTDEEWGRIDERFGIVYQR